MYKIGFIDYYLDTYHSKHFPEWIQSSRYNKEFEIACAFAEVDKEGGLKNREYAQIYHIPLANSIEEVIEKSDCILILAPDETHAHERLSNLALKSGKPVFVDKTLADNAASARRMVDLAKEYNTPIFCASSLRFSEEYQILPKKSVKEIDFVSLFGPISLEMHILHQIEILVSICGVGALRVRNIGTVRTPVVEVEYPDCRAHLAVIGKAPYGALISYKDGTYCNIPEFTNFFQNSTDRMLEFFMDGVPKTPIEETVQVVSLHTAVLKCHHTLGEWIEIGT